MSVLAVAAPARERSAAEASGGPARAAPLPSEFSFVLSQDGQSVTQVGRSAPSAFPKADRLVLVLGDTDVSWHRVLCPKAPPARLRQALAGVMEELLLDDDEELHLALAPGAKPGQKSWVAAMNLPWLAGVLNAIEAAGRQVEKVVPISAPTAQPLGHFSGDEGASEAGLTLSLSRKEGVSVVGLNGGLARALLPPRDAGARWTATPSAAAAAERWLGERVAVITDAERVLRASRSSSNLRQFSLATGPRGLRAVRDVRRHFFSASWRPLRWGLVALLVLNLAGLNAYAWQQGRLLADKRQAMTSLLQTTFPNVRAVIDPAVQMQRETERARALAGRVGEGDFEALLGAAAAAWPDGQPPSANLRFETGRLTLAVPGWGDAQVRQLRDRLRGAGYAVEFVEGRITVTREAAAK